MEIWKPVVGFESHYSVSNLGRVRREKAGQRTHPGRMLKPYRSTRGYFQVVLFINNHATHRLVHRLVLESLTSPCPPGLQTNHKDGDKTNNRLENLEWVTQSKNMRHAVDNGLHVVARGEQHCRAKLTESDVRAIRRLCAEGLTQTEVARRYDVQRPAIGKIVSRKNWKHV